MAKKNKSNGMSGGMLLSVVVVSALVVLAILGLTGQFQSVGTTEEQKAVVEQQLASISCPDDKTTTVTLNVQNPLNTTGAESFDAEVTFLGDNGEKTTGTDSTDGSYNLNCGTVYELIVESADGASGDNAFIKSVLEGNGAEVTEEGTIVFAPSQATYRLTASVSQHATIETKVYDREDARFAYDSGDASNSEYEGDATTFRDGDNATAFALTNDGDYLDLELSLRSVQTDTEFGDGGFFIAVEAPVTEYDEPTVSFNGVTLEEIKGSGLNEYESKQLSNYEYVYFVDESIVRKAKTLGFYIEANSDASTDVEIDLVAIGKVDSIDGVNIITSSAQDNSASTTVYSVMDFTVDVS